MPSILEYPAQREYGSTVTANTIKGKIPIDIVTYRYNGELVYVPAAPDYIQALSHAREAFPQLKKLHNASLSLSLEREHQPVGISAPAWPKLVAHMSRYQVIDVHVTQAHERDGAVPIPHIIVTYADADDVERTKPAPPYCEADTVDDEKASYPRQRSPSPSPSTLQPGKLNWLLQKLHGQ